MSKRTIWNGSGFEPMQNFRIGCAVNQQITGAHGREILDNLTDAIVCGDRIVSCDGGFAVGGREFGGFAQTRKYAIARRAVGGELGERCRCFRMLAGFRKCDRLLKRCARKRGLLRLPPLVTAPAADAYNDDDAGRNEVNAVALPQLFEPFAADFLINFMENIGHASALKASSQSGSPPRGYPRLNGPCLRPVR